MATIENQGVPIQIKMRTTITQGDQTEEFPYNIVGQLFQKSGQTYIRYQESAKIKVTLKVTDTGAVHLLRAGETRTKLTFEKEQTHLTHYQTPYGNVPLSIHTQQLFCEIKEEVTGQIEVHYQLQANGEVLGDYQLYLEFEKEKDQKK
ncbi:DUF1934 domain-containing protein [Vagococcus entomophilus]|uniref:DUF1934 domain-containing protein n=1 Tax=Vagococcus entomophilus TaxID=1160095 RepID=A0A430AID4_9ENTE|nr:DUF1934 domain-containing protein [Vagococcus entomophilus]RSU07798.1 hypothetical protein CBF30_00735 [Vagococcus entomophilus]